MPTHDEFAQFVREFTALTPAQPKQFIKAMKQMVADLRAGTGFRPSLRVKGVQGHPRIFEMTWAGNGRATFEYGPEQKPGEPHIIWRRIGGHDVLKNP
jgi:hypothetical protein